MNPDQPQRAGVKCAIRGAADKQASIEKVEKAPGSTGNKARGDRARLYAFKEENGGSRMWA